MSDTLQKAVKILIVDDHLLIRKGITTLLNSVAGIKSCHHAENGQIALEKCRNEFYDIIFLDIAMPVMDGVTTMHHLKKEFPDCNVVILTMFENKYQFIELIELGVKGYLLKDSDETEMIKAINFIMEGGQYFTPLVYKVWTEHIYKKNKGLTKELSHSLTLREMEVLRGICLQLSAKEIGDKYSISESTVNNHRSHIMDKTEIHSTVGLVIYAIKNGIYIP